MAITLGNFLNGGGSGGNTLSQVLSSGNDANLIPIVNLSTLQFNGPGYIIDNIGNLTQDIENRILYSSEYGMASIDYQNHFLRYGNSIPVSWGDSGFYLADTSGFQSVNWFYRNLNDQTGNNALNYQNRYLFDNNSIISDNWDSRILFDQYANYSIDYNNRQLINNFNVIIDWNLQFLYDQNGLISLDWANRLSRDASGIESFNYQTRSTINHEGNVSIDWDSHIIYTKNGFQSINFSGHLTSPFNISHITQYANDGAAGAAGLISGDAYLDNSYHITLKS